MTPEPSWPQMTGQLIKTYRRRRGWTQGELARRIAGDQKTISRLELGVNEKPDARSLVGVLMHLIVPRHEILAALALPDLENEFARIMGYDDRLFREARELAMQLAVDDQLLLFDVFQRLVARLARELER